ncbi:MAG: LPXTG cell wall anchor domain-containing protein [Clostridia bacterium]|nr:LPXTG cell wall anchor domain-containing protein [Clostridia bacterium]
MKKIVKLSLVLLMIIGMTVNVYAASCTVNLQPSKKEVKVNEEVVIDVELANVQDSKGMISLTATLDYDRNSLTFVKIEGQNTWKPSYNDENGKIAAEREDYAKGSETIFKVTFKVKEQSEKNIGITLKDIIFSNGDQDIDAISATTKVELGEGASNPNPTPTPDPNPNPNPNPGTNTIPGTDTNTIIDVGGNNNTNKTNTIGDMTTKNEKLPQTGDMDVVLFAIGGVAALTAIFFVKVKIIDKNMKN